MAPAPSHTQRPQARVRWTLAALGVVLITLGAILGRYALQPTPFDPLDLPRQTVLNAADPATGHPTVPLDGDVRVRAKKCNTADVPILVSGLLSWQSVRPAGSIIEVGSGTTPRNPGCVVRRYSNPIPAEVIARTAQLLDRGEPYVLWRIVGTETPVTSGPSVTRTWSTQKFAVVR
jgi:hypothetical protein